MCNLYSSTTTQEAMRRLFPGLNDQAGNLQPGRVYPNYLAPVVRHDGGALTLTRARWGLPTPKFALKTARDPGVTNVRNLASPHWRGWLGKEHRCLVPVTAFAEPIGRGRGNQWFAAKDGGEMFFAGIEVRGWTSVRKIKDGETTDDLFGFLTCPPNAEVETVHPKAMPVILTSANEWTAWMNGIPASEMQRPMPDGSLILTDAPPE